MWSAGFCPFIQTKNNFWYKHHDRVFAYTNGYIFSLLFPQVLVQKLCKKIFCILIVKIGDLSQNINISIF